VAALYLIFIPGRDKLRTTTGWRFLVLRWFHGAVWLVLALSFLIRTTPLKGIADLVALVAGILYAVYIATFLQGARRS
jgi:hypothetical protein